MNSGFSPKDAYHIDDLVAIMSVLRGEHGCPWDRAQDHHSLRNHFIEETYEAVEAIDLNDAVHLREELGDVLLQVIFHSQLEAEKSSFTFDDVCNDICKKMVSRHPYVFGNQTAPSVETAGERWEERKREEKQYTSSTQYLELVSRALPALMRTEKLISRAGKRGLDAPKERGLAGIGTCLARLMQLSQDSSPDERKAMWGAFFFAAVAAASGEGITAEEALEGENERFISRFARLETLAMERYGGMDYCDTDALNNLWPEAEKLDLSGK